VLNLTCKARSMSVVDIYHRICEVDWLSICLVQSTALEQDLFDMGGGHLPPYLCRWTGDQFGLQGLFNMAGGHLPPYWCSGLVVNLACKACSIWVVNIYHHICAVDWCAI
jgi:hypothetical protein